jgi:uncharacterized damage-inducible protein DinB
LYHLRGTGYKPGDTFQTLIFLLTWAPAKTRCYARKVSVTTTCYSSLDAFLVHWDGVRMVTLELLESFEEKDLSFRLVPEWRTVAELFHHVGGHQYFVSRGVFTKRWNPRDGEPDEDWAAHRETVCTSRSALADWLSSSQRQMHQWRVASPPELLEAIRDDNPWHEGIRGWLLLHHSYQDELHHRGQLYAIARLLGRTPPEVYAEEHSRYWDEYKGR